VIKTTTKMIVIIVVGIEIRANRMLQVIVGTAIRVRETRVIALVLIIGKVMMHRS
jgi:hypothetical protein